MKYDLDDGLKINWQKPKETPVPILYYRVEYRNGSETLWHVDTPVPANRTSTRFIPKSISDNKFVKYYFRVRSYGQLSYSGYSEAVIIHFPSK